VEYFGAFLKRTLEYANYFFQYEGDDMNIEMAHEESCFSPHDGKATIWMDANDRPLRPKGQGRSIMVSEFICECHGPMKLNEAQRAEHPDVAFETCTIIQPGKHEGYWITANLIEKVKAKAMPIFKILHPETDAVCLFDNSQNHSVLPPDALRVSVLNLSDGGKNVLNIQDGSLMRTESAKFSQCKIQMAFRREFAQFSRKEVSGIQL
jgi:hypothetical protein